MLCFKARYVFLMTFIFYFAIDIYNEVNIKQSPPTRNNNIAKNAENTKKITTTNTCHKTKQKTKPPKRKNRNTKKY